MDIKGGNLTKHRKNIAVLGLLIAIAVMGLLGRLAFLMILRSEHYSKMALELHQRERSIKAARGRILDTKGKVIADNRTVCTVSVIYNQALLQPPHSRNSGNDPYASNGIIHG